MARHLLTFLPAREGFPGRQESSLIIFCGCASGRADASFIQNFGNDDGD